MTVLEQSPEQTKSPGRTGSVPAAPPPPPPRAPSRFARYFTRVGWVHALLLLLAWLFIFPFLWMLFTSVKVDDELPEARILPTIPTYRPASPYVRAQAEPLRPTDVELARWDELLPRLREVAEKRVGEIQSKLAPLPTLAPIDPAQHRASAASTLVNYGVGKLHKEVWSGPEADLFKEYGALLTDDAARWALSTSLAQLDLLAFQIRTLDFRIHNITDGPDFATQWTVESGPGKLIQSDTSTLLSYDFDATSEPIVLRADFHLPDAVNPADLHKIIVSARADDSWHGINAQLDLAGTRWVSQRTTYLAQHRAMSFIFQPPTFDDDMLRPKMWIPLRPARADDAPAPASSSQSAIRNPQSAIATLRVIIDPSSTANAIYGKIIRNYQRAFDRVPFWHFIGNSFILVALTTLGSIFSASFVAYAFARLNWPGRSIAFLLLLATMMLPPQVTMIPGFLIWRGLGWYNTLNPIWVPSFFGTAFFIFLMTQHMRTIPKELEEAARIDGLGAVQSWYYIILPNVKPTLAAIAILSFMGAWNEFLQPLIYIRDQSKFPLALGLYGLKVDQFNVEATDWTLIMAGDILMTIPVIAVFFLFQRYFVQGMTMTGMKG